MRSLINTLPPAVENAVTSLQFDLDLDRRLIPYVFSGMAVRIAPCDFPRPPRIVHLFAIRHGHGGVQFGQVYDHIRRMVMFWTLEMRFQDRPSRRCAHRGNGRFLF